MAFLLPLAWIDLREFRLPDQLTLPLILIGLLLSVIGAGPPLLQSAIGAIVGFTAFWALGAFYFAARNIDGLGLGDAKLLAAAGAWLGWSMLPWVVLWASLSAVTVALILGQQRLSKLAFGPWLCASFLMLWIWAQRL